MTDLARESRPSWETEAAENKNSPLEYRTPQAEPQPDRNQVARFAEVLHGQRDQAKPSDAVATFILTAGGTARQDRITADMRYTRNFPGDAEGVNSYMAVCRFASGTQGRKAADAVLVPGVWADLDIKPDASDQPHSAGELDAIMAALPEPTMLVDSGSGGLHPYWLYPEMSAETEQAAALLRRWHRYLGRAASEALGRPITVDSVFDLARIMKVPGTWRWPKGSEDRAPVRLLVDDGPRYSYDQLWELSEAGAEPVPAKPREGTQASGSGRKRSSTLPAASLGPVTAAERRWRPWVTSAVERHAEELAAMDPGSGRNNALNAAAMTLGGLAAHGDADGCPLLDEDDVRQELRGACEENGLLADDGPGAFEATFASGWDAGQARPGRLPAWMTGTEQKTTGTGTGTVMSTSGSADTDTDGTASAELEWPTPEDIAKNAKIPLPGSGERIESSFGIFGIANRGPRALWAMVDGVAETYQVPRDLPFMLALPILSVAVGGHRSVRVKPDWVEQLSVYSVVGLPSGERKSPVIARMSGPLRRVEAEHIETERPKVAEAKAKRDLQQSAVNKRKSKGDTSDEAVAMAAELEQMKVPALPRLLADDATPEALARIMSEQDGRLGVLSAEGGMFATLAGRYSSGEPNLDLVLKAWSGDECRIDRAARDREPILMKQPTLSIGLAIQPAIISGLAEGKNFRGSGLLARFLYALPASLVGTRAIDPPPLANEVERAYAEQLEALARAMVNAPDAELRLDDDARKLLIDFQRGLEPRLHPEHGDLAHLADWANKLAGELVRVAALFTLFEVPSASEVSGEAMAGAIDLAPYFIGHALDAFELMSGRNSPLEPARAVLKWIQREERDTVTVRQIGRALNGQAWVAEGGNDAVREALADLEELGYVREVMPKMPKPGRPSSRYEVNPSIGIFGMTNRGTA